MKYDAIVIGAGNGGLLAALTLQKEGKDVLVLESTSMSGGYASSFVRGRFEFETSLQMLMDYGNQDNHGSLYEIMERADLTDSIEMIKIPESIYVITNKEKYSLPFGKDQFILKMEEYFPKSRESMEHFFELAEEVYQALHYLNKFKKINADELKRKYPNFMKVSSYSVERVLDVLEMPKKVQELLMSQWSYFGSSSENLSFVQFASTIYSYITIGAFVPKNRSHEISVAIQNKFESYGGTILFLSGVKKVIFENNKICGVRCQDGNTYYADHIISNVSPTVFYGSFIPKEMQTDRMRQLCNARTLGGRSFTIYLGLNRSASDLKLNHYRYILANDLDHKKEFSQCRELYHTNCVATVLNQMIPDCSEPDTTILTISTLYTSDIFSDEATEDNYFKLKNKIADHFITVFEKTTNIMIRDSIEEIEIATPVTFARYGGHPTGSTFGYMAKGYDNILPRIINETNESCFPHVHFCGAFASRLAGYSSTYFSGELAAYKTLQDMEKEERNDLDEDTN